MLKILNFSRNLLNISKNVPVLQQPICSPLQVLTTFARNTANSESISSSLVLDKLNRNIENNKLGRLFAVVQLCGKQFKITSGDVIVVEGYWPPGTGDQIKLEKVLLVGGNDFSIIGKPLVNPGLVNIKATIIEKTLSHTRTHFKKKRRKQYLRINFQRNQNTMLMVNSIELANQV